MVLVPIKYYRQNMIQKEYDFMERKVASLIKGVPYLSQSDKPLHKYLSL